MHPLIEANLALVLFLPWYLVIAIAYWRHRARPASWLQRLFDSLALLAAMIAAAIGGWWSFHSADPDAGNMWKHVLSTVVGYGCFLLVVLLALLARGPQRRAQPR
jgi:hypothetical protein